MTIHCGNNVHDEEEVKMEDSNNSNNNNSSPVRKVYDRDSLIQIGNQAVSVFTVPESFLELAKEAGSSTPIRQLGQPPPLLNRMNSRGSGGGGGIYGGSIRNSNNNNSNGHGFGFGGGGFGFGGMMGGGLLIPPPPPASREPKAVISIKKEKLLPSDPNAWKPGRLKKRASSVEEQPKSEEELAIENIKKETRGILNKLTPENFERLMEKFNTTIELDNKDDRISAVINVLFEKAIDEPAFSAAYAKMVQSICKVSVEASRIFRKQLLDKCQFEFQRIDTEEDKAKALATQLEGEAEGEKKEALKAELEDLKFTMRKRALGNVRFIGELFKLEMLSAKIMVSCIRLLLSSPDDEKLECLCKLLSTVGEKLDDQLRELEQKAKKEGKPQAGPQEKLMDNFFLNLEKLSGDSKKFCSRIRFAIMDVVELRQNAWKPRRVAAGPKKIEEVHRDALLQELEEKQKIQSLAPLSPESRDGQKSHHNTPISHVPKKGDWTHVQNKGARFAKKSVDRAGPSTLPQQQPFFGFGSK